MQQAQETVKICEQGHYIGPDGRRVDITEQIARANAGTIVYSPENPPLRREERRTPKIAIEVVNETTFSALRRLSRSARHLACLNFASAKNPGGGFLNGSQAQEEALARASALYPCLLAAPEYYERNRATRSAIYLDLAISSPLVPFFRDDSGKLLEEPIMASVITAPAPNAGAVAQNEPHNSHLIKAALLRRSELVLEIARAHEVTHLVLGAWGCGVFRNDPIVVASIFQDLLKPAGKFGDAFQKVAFAVYDRAVGQSCFRAFDDAFQTQHSITQESR